MGVAFVSDLCLVVFTTGFFFFRIGEVLGVVPLLSSDSVAPANMQPVLAALAAVAVVALTAAASRRLTWRLSLCLVLLALRCLDLSYEAAPFAVDLTGKTALVTGGNSGVGFEAARALALSGATVVVACRGAARCASAAERINTEVAAAGGGNTQGGRALPMSLDLSSVSRSVRVTTTSLRRACALRAPHQPCGPVTLTATHQPAWASPRRGDRTVCYRSAPLRTAPHRSAPRRTRAAHPYRTALRL
jgi:hypothetical protein